MTEPMPARESRAASGNWRPASPGSRRRFAAAAPLALALGRRPEAALAQARVSQAEGQPSEIRTVEGRSLVLEHPNDIVRFSVAHPRVIDAVAVSAREVVLNAKPAGPGHAVEPGAVGVDQPFWSGPGGAPAGKATGQP